MIDQNKYCKKLFFEISKTVIKIYHNREKCFKLINFYWDFKYHI